MIVEPAPAKINLALHVLGRRADGYHELDSIVGFADVGDRLSFAPAARLELIVEGPFAAGLPAGEDNLAMRAARALGEDTVPARIVLRKELPISSGMGGGSSDAAAVLRGLPRLSGRVVAPERLRKLALSLGADVPACLHGRACRMRGAGEHVEDVGQAGPWHVLLANPGIALSTAAVFGALGLRPGETSGSPIGAGAALEDCRNDLEAPAIRLAPAVATVLEALRGQDGARLARMTGSGATCFGLFGRRADAERAAAALRRDHRHWWIKAATLR